MNKKKTKKKKLYPGTTGNFCQLQGTFTALGWFYFIPKNGRNIKNVQCGSVLYFFQRIKFSSHLLPLTHGLFPIWHVSNFYKPSPSVFSIAGDS